MPMTYASLTGAKGSAGSIMNWVGNSTLDVATILDESQSLIYGILRTREMRTAWMFGMAAGACSVALPDRFLDPLGALRDITNNIPLVQKDQPVLEEARVYETAETGTLGMDAFTTTLDSSLITVNLPGHDMVEGSAFTPIGATATGGISLTNTFPVVSVTDADNFVIDAGDNATSTATGGGPLATYTADVLISGLAGRWAIFDERLNFDVAFQDQTSFRLPYFRSPALLSGTNQSNFLTNRYPKLLRIATTAAAAEFMKDDEEYQKGMTALGTLVQSINAENEMFLRGGSYGTDTPTPGDYY